MPTDFKIAGKVISIDYFNNTAEIILNEDIINIPLEIDVERMVKHPREEIIYVD